MMRQLWETLRDLKDYYYFFKQQQELPRMSSFLGHLREKLIHNPISK
jgi:hypothetical protein